jgi:hypothetical protein
MSIRFTQQEDGVILPNLIPINPFMSLSESNNQSKILKLSSNLALSLYFLTVTKIYNQKLKTKAPKGFQR